MPAHNAPHKEGVGPEKRVLAYTSRLILGVVQCTRRLSLLEDASINDLNLVT